MFSTGLLTLTGFILLFSFPVWSGRGGGMPSSRRAVEPMQQPHLAASIAKARASPCPKASRTWPCSIGQQGRAATAGENFPFQHTCLQQAPNPPPLYPHIPHISFIALYISLAYNSIFHSSPHPCNKVLPSLSPVLL